MNRIVVAICTILSIGTPALADTDVSVTLEITNDAGAVTMVQNMTWRECNAAMGLLGPQKLYMGTFYGDFSITENVYQPWKPHTPYITKVECTGPASSK